MSKEWESFTQLFDNKGNFLGVMITADLWNRTKHAVMPILNADFSRVVPDKPEPLKDWEALKQYWDFRYPVNLEVHCDLCDNQTADWEKDTPKKFRLLACNIGGLARFRCEQCRGTVTKRHFKDEIKCTCVACED